MPPVRETQDVSGKCVVCGGKIVEKRVKEYDPAMGPPIYGPGFRDQVVSKFYGYYCASCGLKYEFVPDPPEY